MNKISKRMPICLAFLVMIIGIFYTHNVFAADDQTPITSLSATTDNPAVGQTINVDVTSGETDLYETTNTSSIMDAVAGTSCGAGYVYQSNKQYKIMVGFKPKDVENYYIPSDASVTINGIPAQYEMTSGEYKYFYINVRTKCKVTIIDNTSGSTNEYLVEYGEVFANPNFNAPYGSEFRFYKENGTTPYDFSAIITGDTTIIAKQVKVYTINFNDNGGTSVPQQKVDYGEKAVEPNPAPTKPNNNFEGWYLEGTDTKYDFNQPVYNNIFLDAHWTHDGTYSDVVINMRNTENINNDYSSSELIGLELLIELGKLPATYNEGDTIVRSPSGKKLFTAYSGGRIVLEEGLTAADNLLFNITDVEKAEFARIGVYINSVKLKFAEEAPEEVVFKVVFYDGMVVNEETYTLAQSYAFNSILRAKGLITYSTDQDNEYVYNASGKLLLTCSRSNFTVHIPEGVTQADNIEYTPTESEKDTFEELYEIRPSKILMQVGEPAVQSEYVIESGANQTYTIGSGKDIVIKASGNLSALTGLLVDGTALNDSQATKASGSTIATIKSSYLDTLAVGSHTVKFQYNDGSCETTLTVVAANTNPGGNSSSQPATSQPVEAVSNTPKTGDEINLWITLMAVSLFGIIATVTIYKKEK